jgi:hypothetical protein
LGVRDAVDGATKAADEAGLPQGEGGPADAYRHLLIAGELRRRFGPLIGGRLTSAYEYLNDREGQTDLDRGMDDINNALVHDAPVSGLSRMSSAGRAARSPRPRRSTATARTAG